MNKTMRLQKLVDSTPGLYGAVVERKGGGFYLRRSGNTLAWFKTYATGLKFIHQVQGSGRGIYAQLR